jgi:hypothetical protein
LKCRSKFLEVGECSGSRLKKERNEKEMEISQEYQEIELRDKKNGCLSGK